MKQVNAASLATLRIPIVLAMLGALPVSPVSAVTIQLTGGGISVNSLIPLGGDLTISIGFEGPQFAANGDFRYDNGLFPLGPFRPGTTTDFSGFVSVLSGFPGGVPVTFNNLTYLGHSYSWNATIVVGTPIVLVAPLVTVPFTLQGFGTATDFTPGSPPFPGFEFEVKGSGTATIESRETDDGLGGTFLEPLRLRYALEPPPIPEPTSWLLLGSGLLGYVARRGSARGKG